MADALAAMHWEAEIDANDVEFVLGSPRQSPQASPLLPSSAIARMRYDTCTRWRDPSALLSEYTHASEDSGPSQLELWLLDFDCCGIMTLDDEGIEKATSAFFRNDPYFPRPCSSGSRDYELWECFRLRYLVSSKVISQRRYMDASWAEKFIERLVAQSELPKQERNAPYLALEGTGVSDLHGCFIPLQAVEDAEVDDVKELSAYFEGLG